MKLTRYDSAADFLRHARPALEENEAANNLIIGIPARVAERPGVYGGSPPYFATVNEGNRLIAATVRTPPHHLVVYSALDANPAPLRLILDDVLDFGRNQPPDSPAAQLSGINAHSETALAFARLWSEQTGKPYKPGMRLRIYELREVFPPQNASGHLRPARDDELDLLTEWCYWFNVDCRLPALDRGEARELASRYLDGGNVFLWEIDGQPVSMVGRGRQSSHGITVNLVYTPPELRGRGYASAGVAALSQQLLDAGWEFCTLYTDLDNPTSNDIYQRIGYRPVRDSNEYLFSA